jgi:hypothetical protein
VGCPRRHILGIGLDERKHTAIGGDEQMVARTVAKGGGASAIRLDGIRAGEGLVTKNLPVKVSGMLASPEPRTLLAAPDELPMNPSRRTSENTPACCKRSRWAPGASPAMASDSMKNLRRLASDHRRAATYAGLLGRLLPKVKSRMTFCPEAIIRTSAFTFSSRLSLNRLKPCQAPSKPSKSSSSILESSASAASWAS